MRELTARKTKWKHIGVVNSYKQSPTADTVNFVVGDQKKIVQLTGPGSTSKSLASYPKGGSDTPDREAEEVLNRTLSMEAQCH